MSNWVFWILEVKKEGILWVFFSEMSEPAGKLFSTITPLSKNWGLHTGRSLAGRLAGAVGGYYAFSGENGSHKARGFLIGSTFGQIVGSAAGLTRLAK